ncbi:YkgJ family cysteine cluster protein [Rhodanobacter aciditrophus]|uniref:YkgJ family cysteine cluster protein n=1 Tax=Rhodanobacter aciditrophus TaxID=1623218 RepID=UPI003CE9BF90
MSHPCLSCGACCAHFRIAFHWSETDPSLGGTVPVALTEKLDPHRVVMRGTQSKTPRCVALAGEIGVAAHCGIHPIKPSVCREVEPSWEFGRHSPQCDKGRIAHGLQPLTPEDWIDSAGSNPPPLPGSA